MIFAISGSQGVGKSTLINALHTSYPSITRKTSRSILSDWGVTLSEVNNDRELTVRFQDEILKRKWDDEAEARSDHNRIFCTERTYADLFVYALVAIGKDNEYSDWIDDYYVKCVNAQACYSDVFYLTGGHFRPEHDGVRAINEHYSRMVDLVMYEYTKQITFDGFKVISTPDLSQRIKYLEKYYTKHGELDV